MDKNFIIRKIFKFSLSQLLIPNNDLENLERLRFSDLEGVQERSIQQLQILMDWACRTCKCLVTNSGNNFHNIVPFCSNLYEWNISIKCRNCSTLRDGKKHSWVLWDFGKEEEKNFEIAEIRCVGRQTCVHTLLIWILKQTNFN